jgi:hypothetical protein
MLAGVATRIPLDGAGSEVERIRENLDARLAAAFPLDSLSEVPKRAADAARRFWSQRAWSEFAAVPALSQVLLKLVSQRAPFGEVAALSGILHDEALHTELSKSVADALGGYVDEVPEHLKYEPYALAAPNPLELAAWLLAGGCVAETVSRALIQARLTRCKPTQLRALMQRTLRDENLHVAFAWSAAKRAVKGISERKKEQLVELAQPTVASLFSTQCTAGLSGPAAATERKLRQRVADAELGCLEPDEEDAVVKRCLEEEVVPRLRRLGLPVRTEPRAGSKR